MIEQTIIAYLGRVQDVPVYAETPVNPPASYILIERTGGSELNRIRRAMIALQTVTDDSLYAAAQMAETNRDQMLDLISERNVYRCTVDAGPYNFTDPSTKTFRYQTVYEIYYQ